MKRSHAMKKNINIAIATAAFTISVGTCGGLECGTIAFAPAAVIIIAFAVIAIISSNSAHRIAAIEAEEVRRSAARAARLAERVAASRPAARRIHSVELAHR